MMIASSCHLLAFHQLTDWLRSGDGGDDVGGMVGSSTEIRDLQSTTLEKECWVHADSDSKINERVTVAVELL